MTTLDDGRKLFVWLEGKDPSDNASRLADAIAEAAAAELFSMSKSLHCLNNGKLTPVNKDHMRGIIARHVASVRLVGAGLFGWKTEYYSFDFPVAADTRREPDQKVLLEIIELLVKRVAAAPSEPLKLTPQHEIEARARLKTGEPKSRIAAAYGVEVEAIEQLTR